MQHFALCNNHFKKRISHREAFFKFLGAVGKKVGGQVPIDQAADLNHPVPPPVRGVILDD